MNRPGAMVEQVSLPTTPLHTLTNFSGGSSSTQHRAPPDWTEGEVSLETDGSLSSRPVKGHWREVEPGDLPESSVIIHLTPSFLQGPQGLELQSRSLDSHPPWHQGQDGSSVLLTVTWNCFLNFDCLICPCLFSPDPFQYSEE